MGCKESLNSEAVVEVASAAFAQGSYVIVVDDRDGKCECNLAFPAAKATAERVAFTIRHSTGLVSACLDRERLEGFGMHPQTTGSSDVSYPSVDFLPGMTTGISAKDRAATLQALCDASNSSSSFSIPGHTFTRCVGRGGVMERQGSAEAAYDLCRIARLESVGVLAELMREDGSTFSLEGARQFSQEHGIPLVTVEQLHAYRQQRETAADASQRGGGPVLETASRMWMEDVEADCRMLVYSTSDPKVEIVAIVKGELEGVEAVPARVHSECFTGDILGSKRCDCGQQLHNFLRVMNGEPCGVMLYIRGHEGRGIGLANKIRAYKLQDEGLDTVEANLQLGLPVDDRTYEDSLAVFRHLGLKSIRLFTNNPEKMKALECITQEVAALASVACEQNARYLQTKRERLNHRTVLEPGAGKASYQPCPTPPPPPRPVGVRVRACTTTRRRDRRTRTLPR